MGNPQVIEVHIVSGVALIGEVDVDEAGLFYWFGNHKLLMGSGGVAYLVIPRIYKSKIFIE
ncbi:hypothetical protein [Roseivirga thermotolerans]|uniref:hypothetical protein n=1 Tax=Roseivirga thermotolerans TaxID=1758176 RepID=UPI00273EFAD8|nr:hypothetical protein [Roseivirga thermotolerans]